MHYLTFLCLVLFFLPGCALLSPNPNEEDPVAAVALSMRDGRQPSSLSSFETQMSEDRQSSRQWFSARAIESGMASSEIVQGMGMDQVRAIWGEPRAVEVAGDPQNGNQRWTYDQGVSSRFGLSGKRIVYFENGSVTGWQR